jgi:monoamine oxidase
MKKAIIIGGGLSGLTIAYYLKEQNIPFQILEAQEDLGGRIHTVRGVLNSPMEMGATWFNTIHTDLIQLLKDLEIKYFPQHIEGKTIFQTHSFEPPQLFYVPNSEQASFRIKDGTFAIIEKLISIVGKDNIYTNTTVHKIVDKGGHVLLLDSLGNSYESEIVVSTIPPQILIENIQFEPPLPLQLTKLMSKVQTWMSGSIKFAVEYSEPFWLKNGYSGTIYSQSSIAVEVYDHCNYEANKFSLMGFLSSSAINYTIEQREQLVIKQIENLFGSIVPSHISYHEKVWNNQYVLSAKPNSLYAHQNNGHELVQLSYMNDKLFFAGTETSSMHPGYLEGAVRSANRVFKIISEK